MTRRFKAIETRFAGHLFRSRLEARWAAFFEIVGLEWTYEPFDAAGYIPDFLVRTSQGPMVVEVKPWMRDDVRLADEARRAFLRLRSAGQHYDTVAVGCDPDFRTRRLLSEMMAEWGCGYDVTPDEIDPIGFYGPVGFSITKIWDKAEAYLKSIEGTAHFDGAWEGAITPYAFYAAYFHVDDEASMRGAWGEAHEISRWLPVEAR